MGPMYLLALVVLCVLVFSWVVQGVRLYSACKGDIYSDLYGSFFPYFYHYVIIRDCSKSSYLRSRIGTHKIVFSAIDRGEKGRIRFCIIFYNRGVMVLCYDKAVGELQGNATSKTWTIIRKDKEGTRRAYRCINPEIDMKTYLERMAAIFPDVHIEARLAFHNQTDFSKLRSTIKPIHFNEIDRELNSVQADFMSDDEIEAMYKKLIQ